MKHVKPYTYLIKFIPTGQCYYGVRAKNVRLNVAPDDDLMIGYFTSSKYIKQLIEDYGIESFEWEIRRTFDNIRLATEWESKVLTRCKVLKNNKWLNKNIAGFIPPSHESCQKISEYHRGKAKSDDHKRKISEALTGKLKTKEHVENISKALKGKMAGTKNPMYGIPCTEERRKKISEANKGKPRSNEFKQTMRDRFTSDNNPGKNKTESTRRKISKSLRGKKRSPMAEETKKAISKALIGKSKGPMSDEEKNKRSLALLGKSKSIKSSERKSETLKRMVADGTHHSQIKITCPHCGAIVQKLIYPRWHGNNCKQRK